MLQLLISSVMESYRAPRAAVRGVIDRVDSIEGVAIIFALSFALQAMVLAISALVFGTVEAGLFGVLAGALTVSALSFAVIVGLAFGIGRMFGGQGSLLDIATAIAWHSLVTVIFAPFLGTLPVGPADQAGANPIQIVIFVIVFWLFANFIAEAHKFASAWRVAGAMIGIMLGMGVLLSILIFGSISGP
ncbi:MAG: Yip1 family protein [Pseudomonadota bacterium]